MHNAMWVGGGITGMGGIPMLGTGARGLTTLIKGIFRNNEQGFAYDPNDLTTLFQDAAGTIPVTAAGQPVGLMLDKSKPITNTSILDSTFLLADGWIKSNPAISVTNVGGSLRVSKGAINPQSIYRPFSCESGKLYRLTVKYKNHTGNNVRFFVRSAIGAGSNLALSQYIQTFTATAGEGSSLFISSSNTHSVLIDSQNATESSVGVESIVITKVSDSLNHAYQTVSASRPILQRNATTGAYYLAFDGVDDFLQTSSIDFTATDKVSLFAGVRKLSDATAAMFLEYSQNINTNIGSFNITAPSGNAATTYAANINGGSPAGRSADGYVAPISNVLSFHLDASKNNAVTGVMVRINGITPALSGTEATGTSNYGNYPLYIGRRAGTSLPFNGHLYNLIGIGKLTTDGETAALEKSIAKNIGVTLNA